MTSKSTMSTPDYIKSERFIWDSLRTTAAASIPGLYKAWKQAGKIEPFVMAWPGETILDDNGLRLEGVCMLDLPTNKSSWSSTLRHLTERTKAYALLLTEQLEGEVRVILESHHGTRSWSIPVHVSGDIKVLGTPSFKDDTHRIGILWGTRRSG
jgi:hypothetical protein